MFFKESNSNSGTKWDTEAYHKIIKEYEPNISEHELQSQLKSYENLLNSLGHIEENVLFISIGCGTNYSRTQEQAIPTYLKRIAEENKVHALLIDGNFLGGTDMFKGIHNLENKGEEGEDTFTLKNNPNLTVEVFGCFVVDDGVLTNELRKAIVDILDKGGRVFVANHTQAKLFSDIPQIAELCNSIKSEHPQAAYLLQVYTQGGMGPVRYCSKELCDYKTDIYEQEKNGTVQVCAELSDLQFVDEFKPDFHPPSDQYGIK
ncbi:hypothetical protein Lche_2213 [Legionella cherrii]|uniref:Uncharacterized protein n=1 Tax=Legionella cherrii TaxID=28084 RepID=A0A0W0SAP1_9GAMM|nr:hypothetical protein [Legionella cherrii]KTC80193.1 hypothetical protein Lche_2213 [Legionella cherrii]